MINRLAILGATGDLTGRYLLPALATLRAGGHLTDTFELVAAARDDWDDAHFRQHAAAWLDAEASDVPASARTSILQSSRYRRIDLADTPSVAACIGGDGPVVAYLALPPSVFPAAVTALHAAGLGPDSRVVLEKPFGEDLRSATELNSLLAGLMDERQIFRVDHFLAMTTVQTVLGTRLANRVIEPIWNSAHIAEIEIVWEESLALEGRAGYYDGVGALKDMVQNHLLQILCLVAMEPPITVTERDLRDHKVDVLRSIRPINTANARDSTRRGRYTAGRIAERSIPAYVDEDGVDPGRGTETLAEVVLELDGWRWSGTRFRLRTGKALARDHKEVIVHFRPVPHLPFETTAPLPPNRLRFGLEPENFTLELTGGGPGATFTLVPLVLQATLAPPELPAYGRLLLDVLSGDTTLSIRSDEAEESWRVVTPILDAWAKGLVPLEDYPAGSTLAAAGP
ncbi:MAG: glucose-6-phosphate dehydrogenase [Acidimicrobiaceae bacterium]|nr:glucose-6-phosphate dehydrogenase [Acidimicrobiaceae bacterium]